MSISVVVTGRGSVVDGATTEDTAAVAHCDVCNKDVNVTVSLGPTRSCRTCIRERLDATSVATYRLSDKSGGIPWGKVTS